MTTDKLEALERVRRRMSEIVQGTHDLRTEALVEVRELIAWGHEIDRTLAAIRAEMGGVTEGFYIASFRKGGNGHVLWWMPDNRGYTTDLEQAGIYAEPIPDYHENEYTVPVPVSFIKGLRVRRMVDTGDSANSAFWSAGHLRAALNPTTGEM